MEFNSQNSSENLYNALILLHAARLMARLIGVRPAVEISWKTLLYSICNEDVSIFLGLNQWRHPNIVCGDIEGQNVFLRGKILPTMADFCYFAISTGGQVGERADPPTSG